MAFGVLQAFKSYRQLWRRSATHTPALGRGAASLVLGSDVRDETVTIQVGEVIGVNTTGAVNDALRYGVRGVFRMNTAPPAGYAWRLRIVLDGYRRDLIFSETTYGASNMPLEVLLDDVNFNTEPVGGAGVVNMTFELEFIVDPDNIGAAGVDVTVVLPSVYIEQLLMPEVVADVLYIENREPAPGETAVPIDFPTIQFTIADGDGTGIDLAATDVTVDGVTVYTASAFVGPWAGTVDAAAGPGGGDVTFVLTVPAANLDYDSEQLVVVNVVSEITGGAETVDATWSFRIADVIAPVIQVAAMQSKRTLRVEFTDDLQLDAEVDGALNPVNFTVVNASVPAAPLVPIAVAVVPGSTTDVDITFDADASIGANYTLYARALKDTNGNVVSVSGSQVGFIGFVPQRPNGRRFELLDFISAENLRQDATVSEGGDPNNPGTGDLRKLIAVLQDIADVMLCSVDNWTSIIDIDLAPEPFLDAILQDLGNPFASCISDMDENDKRRLARILISIYKQKGTDVGVINAIRFFLGVEVTLDIINCRTYWQLGISQLDLNTILAPPVGSGLWYSFYVVSPVVLTDEQRERMLCIAQYMKGAPEHVLGVTEPGGVVTTSPYWVLSQSLLGATTSPSTILA